MIDTARPIAPLSRLHRAAAARGLCGRARADRSPGSPRSSCSARRRSATSAAPRAPRWRRRRSVSPNSTRCSTRIFSARSFPDWKASRARRSRCKRRRGFVGRSRADFRRGDPQSRAHKATDRRAAFGPPFRRRRRGRNAAPLRSRAAGAHAEAARLPLAFRARRRRHRCAAHVSRCHAACRRVHPPAAPAAPAAPAPHRRSHRRIRLDEGAHRRRISPSRTRWCAPPTRSKSSPWGRGSPASPGRCA